jgi:hypothetical protein
MSIVGIIVSSVLVQGWCLLYLRRKRREKVIPEWFVWFFAIAVVALWSGSSFSIEYNNGRETAYCRRGVDRYETSWGGCVGINEVINLRDVYTRMIQINLADHTVGRYKIFFTVDPTKVEQFEQFFPPAPQAHPLSVEETDELVDARWQKAVADFAQIEPREGVQPKLASALATVGLSLSALEEQSDCEKY